MTRRSTTGCSPSADSSLRTAIGECSLPPRNRARGVTYAIRDEGPGFDPSTLPDPTDPANLERVSGRGLLLIHAFMDEVRHNPTGNEITMVKRV